MQIIWFHWSYEEWMMGYTVNSLSWWTNVFLYHLTIWPTDSLWVWYKYRILSFHKKWLKMGDKVCINYVAYLLQVIRVSLSLLVIDKDALLALYYKKISTGYCYDKTVWKDNFKVCALWNRSRKPENSWGYTQYLDQSSL